jgi:hypothetical protein
MFWILAVTYARLVPFENASFACVGSGRRATKLDEEFECSACFERFKGEALVGINAPEHEPVASNLTSGVMPFVFVCSPALEC